MAESTTGGLVALGLLALAIYSCSDRRPNTIAASTQAAAIYESDSDSSGHASTDDESTDDGDDQEEASREPFDEDAAREAAEEEMASSSYTSEGATYGCTQDCSGHEAGWRWRANTGYQGRNPDSPSFEEGGVRLTTLWMSELMRCVQIMRAGNRCLSVGVDPPRHTFPFR